MAIQGAYNFGGINIDNAYINIFNIESTVIRVQTESGWVKHLKITYSYNVYSSKEYYVENPNQPLRTAYRHKFVIEAPIGNVDLYDLCYTHIKEVFTDFTDV